MRKLDWQFSASPKSNRATRTNLTITYAGEEATFQDISEPQRKAMINILLALEKDLPHAPRND
jgi:hypothetical protein